MEEQDIEISEYAKRLDICDSCDKKEQQVIGTVCNECGCILPIKAAIPVFHCPKGKW